MQYRFNKIKNLKRKVNLAMSKIILGNPKDILPLAETLFIDPVPQKTNDDPVVDLRIRVLTFLIKSKMRNIALVVWGLIGAILFLILRSTSYPDALIDAKFGLASDRDVSKFSMMAMAYFPADLSTTLEQSEQGRSCALAIHGSKTDLLHPRLMQLDLRQIERGRVRGGDFVALASQIKLDALDFEKTCKGLDGSSGNSDDVAEGYLEQAAILEKAGAANTQEALKEAVEKIQADFK